MLKDSYKELEAIVHNKSLVPERHKLSTDVKVERGKAPANGFAVDNAPVTESLNPAAFLSSIAAARQEAQTLFELTQDLGKSLSLSETLSRVGRTPQAPCPI